MATVFRDVPSNFWLHLFYTDEKTASQNLSETTGKIFPGSMPPSLCIAVEILMCSQNDQNLSRQHQENGVNFGHLDEICETLPSNDHHNLLFLPEKSKAETF